MVTHEQEIRVSIVHPSRQHYLFIAEFSYVYIIQSLAISLIGRHHCLHTPLTRQRSNGFPARTNSLWVGSHCSAGNHIAFECERDGKRIRGVQRTVERRDEAWEKYGQRRMTWPRRPAYTTRGKKRSATCKVSIVQLKQVKSDVSPVKQVENICYWIQRRRAEVQA